MNTPSIVALLLAAAVALASWRAVRGGARHRFAQIALQVVGAVLLYLCLFPPTTQETFAAGELVVLTPAATPQQLAALPATATLVALPGAPETRAGERVPDLATALRRHADTRSLHVVGAGLPARDRDAARGLVARFDAAPLPRGLVEVEAPAWTLAGHLWRIAGRVEQVAQGRAELRDPAGAVVATSPLDAHGRFAVSTPAKGPGEALFALRIVDAGGARVDEIALPLIARAGEPLKVLLLAGAPDAELKYLRRWAVDAGVQFDSRMTLSEGVALTEGAPSVDADALRSADVVIVDERAWSALSASQKQLLAAAVRDGLGLLLRVTGPLSAQVADEWAALGFRTRAAEAAPAVSLDHALALGESGPAFARRPLDVDAKDAAALLRGDDGSALALWRNEGSGRVALWWLADSYRLALGGARAQYGTLWSDALATVARARAGSVPQLPREARVGERVVLCDIAPAAFVEAGQGVRVDLGIEHDAAGRRCAGYWPAEPGWHVLVEGERRWPFRVRTADEAMALKRAGDAAATSALLGASGTASTTGLRPLPLPRWPFFLGWFATIALLWWLERGSRVEAAPP
jgi:hypothetical protein